jgi:hypothetical protein
VLEPEESLELEESLDPDELLDESLELDELESLEELLELDELESLDELLDEGSGVRGAVTPSPHAVRPTAPAAPASRSRKLLRPFSSPSLSLAIKASCRVPVVDIR